MNSLSIISIVAAFCVGFIIGIYWPGLKYRRQLSKQREELKSSTDKLESAVDNNKQKKG